MNREQRRKHLAYEVQRRQERGLSVRGIARDLGIARKTVDKILKEIEAQREGSQSATAALPCNASRASKLDAYEKKLRCWIEDDARITATECLKKLEEIGFAGGYTIVRERVKQIRAELHPKAPAEVIEYVPAQRGEFDWSPYVLDSGLKINLWNTTLSWSHSTYAVACLRTRQAEVFRCLRESFEDFGGVPRECITDSMPGVVDRWECDQPVINLRFLGVAVHYDFEILIAPRACPKAKPRTERFFLYHEGSFLPGRKFPTFESYQEQFEQWLREVAQQRPHSETGRPIVDMLAEARPHLKPLPRAPYDTRDIVVRVIDPYGFVHYETNLYPVPAPVGERVYVCVGVQSLEVCDLRARRLIEHERLADGAKIRMEQLTSQRRRHRYDLDELVDRVGEWSGTARDYAGRLRDSCRYPGPQLARLLQLQLDWALDDIVGAMKHAMNYRCYDLEALLRILEVRYQPRSLEARLGEATRQRTRALMRAHPITRRPLSSYRSLSAGDKGAHRKEGPSHDEEEEQENQGGE